ncbi:MAG: hypothetical protein IJT44_01950 [Clostridia bacterium]|nr:hypothetical protein [Lachnospiraceae bacterium]MBQ7541037.1 hypothetical protein [Clostridia bacterium]
MKESFFALLIAVFLFSAAACTSESGARGSLNAEKTETVSALSDQVVPESAKAPQTTDAVSLYKSVIRSKEYEAAIGTKAVMTMDGYGRVFHYDRFLFASYDLDADGTDELLVQGSVPPQDDEDEESHVWYIFAIDANGQVVLTDAIHGTNLYVCEKEQTLYVVDRKYGNDCIAFSLYEFVDGEVTKTHGGSTEWIMNDNTNQMAYCYYMDGKAYLESELEQFTGWTSPLTFLPEDLFLRSLDGEVPEPIGD